MSDALLKFGTLGAARIAPSALIKPAREVHGVEVTAVAARDRSKASAFATKHGIPRVLDSYDELISDPDVDAIYNPLPNGLHGHYTIAALEAGKHVLCEKPFTANADEAEAVAAVVAQHPELVVMEAFHWRYHPLADRIRTIIASGELGPVRNIETFMCIPLPLPNDIRFEPRLAGGALMDTGCYAIHQLRTFAQAAGAGEPRVASATAKTLGRRPTIDRWIRADLDFPDSAGETRVRGRIHAALWSGVGLRITVRITGSAGELRCFNVTQPAIFHRASIRSAIGKKNVHDPDKRPTYWHQLGAFAAAIAGDRSHVLTGPDDAVANMRVIDDVYRAAGLEPRSRHRCEGHAMTGRPPAIRLDDLAEPRFLAAAREMLDAMDLLGVDVALDADSILDEARTSTGLDDLGVDDAYFERLHVYLAALDGEAGLSGAGRLITRQHVVQVVANRLLAHDYVARHPDVLDERVDAPIVVVGLPRTGTTHLHNLIAADTRLRSLPYWESLEPVAPLAEQADAGGQPDGRRERCATGLGFVDMLMPEFRRMHEMTADYVHEESQLLTIDLSTMLFESMAWIPSWRDYYRAHDQRPHYDFLRRTLQLCQHANTPAAPARRWVLKSPQHLEQIPAVLHAFPDAVVVFTHRDPVAVVASFATMAAYAARTNRAAPIDVPAIAAYWRDRILQLFAACVRDRDLVPAERSVDVQFDEFMADDIAMVDRIYGVAGLSLTGEARRAMDGFMATHPRGKFGAVLYDLDELGLDAPEIRRAAADYIERFGVALEDRW